MNETVLYQFENDYRDIDCGMFYAVQCPDGSFFLIDSAHQNSVMDHIRIHDFLRERTPEGQKIKIAGWFFSHAHQDHIVKFMDFIRYGFTDWEIDALYYNFPDPDGQSSEFWGEEDRITMREFRDLMAAHPELKKVTLHTGDRFTVGNLNFEVLVTWEDVFPMPMERFNDSTVVLMMEACGQKVFWAGDCGLIEADILTKRFKKEQLKADILQLAHHGFRGGSVELYEMIDAPVVLIPTRQMRLNDNLERATTKKALELAKEYYVAGNGTVELKLPYTLGTARVYPQAINQLTDRIG